MKINYLTIFLLLSCFASQAFAANDYAPGYGAKVASDEIGSVLIPKVKIQFGADGVASDLSSTNPLPTSSTAAGKSVVANYRNDYSSSPKTAGSYFTVVAATTDVVSEVMVFDSSTEDLLLAYAASCGALGASANKVIIPPMGSGSAHFSIPSGSCVGVKPVSGDATVGIILLTFLK